MSNYPPGVSGNEMAIAGPDEMVLRVECEQEDVMVRPMPPVLWEAIKDAVERRLASPDAEGPVRSLSRLVAEFEALPQILATCKFEGEVDVQIAGVDVYWDCPACETKHTDDVDDYFEDPRIARAEADRDDWIHDRDPEWL